ncbi:ABC1-domain-containing protein [Clavulina sp. PMI_390]|nr:ABC1-domain-containing protein [Clavulina sp. PMI_390]
MLYKQTLGASYDSDDDKEAAYSRCHKRSAERLLEALQANGGIYIKLGQHVSSVNMLPVEWTSTMKPLQDQQCYPTPFPEVKALLERETGRPMDEMFSEFDENPIGVASLAQVHMATERSTGRKMAVKIQHPHLEEFTELDMKTTTFALEWVKRIFPDFEFTWLGEEMRENLPKELDFTHEAENTERARANFANLKRTSLYIPDVITATKRTLVMEFIEGARVDDLDYLAKHNIDRNKVSMEITRIFSEMVWLHGFFHADPHAGNLLIRPRSKNSRSPYNFEIALLDHGLYFDIDDELRVNYARLWLSLITPGQEKDRRKYAELVGHITPELYPIFESAVTGRAGLEGTWDDADANRPANMLELATQTEEEMARMRTAVFHREGLLLGLFTMLRSVPRRVLMLFKMNDLLRNLDSELKPTHTQSRIFLIMARYCSLAVWGDDYANFRTILRHDGPKFSSIFALVRHWVGFHFIYNGLRVAEFTLDSRAKLVKLGAWVRGLRGGLQGAHDAASGLVAVA